MGRPRQLTADEAEKILKAILENTILERANLTKIRALRTQFRQANLTAACLEFWNIDSTTQLEDVACDHVYLLNGQQERRPNSCGFAPGEFTKLFQAVLDTDLAIQSIENKGDGVVAFKVQASAEADKAKIHAEFSEIYPVNLCGFPSCRLENLAKA